MAFVKLLANNALNECGCLDASDTTKEILCATGKIPQSSENEVETRVAVLLPPSNFFVLIFSNSMRKSQCITGHIMEM